MIYNKKQSRQVPTAGRILYHLICPRFVYCGQKTI
nr:MAG TPA: hypothetical protein [Bacteriophage sp.]